MLFSSQVCSFVKSNTWGSLFSELWDVAFTKKCLLSIQTVSLPTRHVSVHRKSREGYSNGLNWDAFQGLKVMGQHILDSLIWFDLASLKCFVFYILIYWWNWADLAMYCHYLLHALLKKKKLTKQQFLLHWKSHLYILKYLIFGSAGRKPVMALWKSHFMMWE